MKRGLVVEGGGMRGAHTCGAMMAMIRQGIPKFDVIAATSSGACTSAYLVSGQYHLLQEIWGKYFHDGRLINLRKLARLESVLDLDYLIHTVFRELAPLDIEAVQKSPSRFYMVATQCETGKPMYFHNHRHPILNSLKASAALPIAYRHPVMIEGQAYIDGGIVDPIPLKKILEEDCDEIYLFLTRPKGFRKKPPLLNLLPRYYQKTYPRLAEAIIRHQKTYNETMEFIEKGKFPCRLKIIRPATKLPVSRLTTNKSKILAAIEQGYREGMLVLSGGLDEDEGLSEAMTELT